MLKDSTVFRDSVQCSQPFLALRQWLICGFAALLMSGTGFANSFATLFSPMGAEYNLASKHPNAEVTLRNISTYQGLMEEMRGECD